MAVGLVLMMGVLLGGDARAEDEQTKGTPQQEEPSGQARAVELDSLERDLGEAYDTATTASDCTIACKALESMIRSAEGICDLEPGPRCEAARAKVDDARRRVRSVCPDCAAAAEHRFYQPKEAPAPRPEPAADPGAVEMDAASPADAPPAEESRGGCAACSLGRRASDAFGLWLVLALALAAARRAGRKRRG